MTEELFFLDRMAVRQCAAELDVCQVVTAPLLGMYPDAVFAHDLPAHRGEEVAGEVLDGPRPLAWTQAAMKLPSAMAVPEHTIGPWPR
ncbi:hypothetical protein ACFVYD_04080 [Streptomyces sp. NPDC058301]|uniref:hypothetical protein n=1 Tax=Streptomyces sp. NPDC058301 TaxID=3346436 RepID=UPI0036F12273